ncbi:MAG TPA: cytochrome c [Rhizomicrobium sp.]|nr:cytochrome c [Rhizomicrobium sp.]
MSRFGFRRICGAAVACFSAIAAGAIAGPAEVAQIKPRQDKLRDMGGALKAIDDELKKRTVDWDNVVLPNVQTLKDRSGYLLNWFPKGSGPESGVKTYALPAIWQKYDDFVKLGKAMQGETAKLAQVAASKEMDALRAQSLATGKACKARHDNYRSPDYEKENED